jgi:hypothetical protein
MMVGVCPTSVQRGSDANVQRPAPSGEHPMAEVGTDITSSHANSWALLKGLARSLASTPPLRRREPGVDVSEPVLLIWDHGAFLKKKKQ